MTDKDIKSKAKDIDSESVFYHLSHAVLACNVTLRNVFREYSKQKIDELTKALIKAKTSGKESLKNDILMEIGMLKKPSQVYVEYNDMAENAGRSTRVGNQLIIHLPLSLAQKTINKNGSYNADAIKKLRQLMAHELGHIILHTKTLLSFSGTQGSKNITQADIEHEANVFARELLELRHKRNQDLHNANAI